MFKQITLAIALSAALSSPTFAHGDDHCKDTQLGGVMKEMSDDLKSYVGAFKRNDQALMQAQVAKLLNNTNKAKDEIPLKLQKDMSNMKGMDHSNMADMPNMKGMDHSNMVNMEGMDHATHMQHMAYLESMDKLTQLFNQLQNTTSKNEVKAILGNIKQHIKKSHKTFRLNCD
ncbi:copper resistance protein CopA [Moritella sp. 24]|uniref:copper resistance protein CopA n=1 Tax=Moritella sp. 24 TaxID=2746230 RepID=UPI001BACCFF0|nr:copper resistance protein CopA [Moritella sp. 24]QUM74835.1 copper resistance protein CopA [Moritella sp. 24]